jgi:hypothetical protein
MRIRNRVVLQSCTPRTALLAALSAYPRMGLFCARRSRGYSRLSRSFLAAEVGSFCWLFCQLLDSLTPDFWIPEAHGLIHSDVFQKQAEQPQPVFLAPEEFPFDQFYFFRTECITRPGFSTDPGTAFASDIPSWHSFSSLTFGSLTQYSAMQQECGRHPPFRLQQFRDRAGGVLDNGQRTIAGLILVVCPNSPVAQTMVLS